MAIRIHSEPDGAIKLALNDSGWLQEDVVAAGQLRQGKAPSTLGMVLGYGVFEVLRPRRSKLLPRHFVLAVTATEVVAFKASGGSSESDRRYFLNIQEEVAGRFPRDAVRVSGLDKGEKSQNATLHVDGESLPVTRPFLGGEPNTDELLAVLSAGSAVGVA